MRNFIFNQFYTVFLNKDEQDAHLAGLITMQLVLRRRLRVQVTDDNGEPVENDDAHPNSATFVYKVRYHDKDIPVGISFAHSIKFSVHTRTNLCYSFILLLDGIFL